MLLMASVNALSYFFRSENWGSLVGKSNRAGESIGFPLEVWEAGNTYGGYFADYPMIGLNMLIAAIASLPLGLLAETTVLATTRWNYHASRVGVDRGGDRGRPCFENRIRQSAVGWESSCAGRRKARSRRSV